MNFKSLLLGSAAAFVAAGGAQAADLSIAEPVDYVRVCDAFGTGYWYIPGTDTCLKIGGKVQFDVKFHKDGFVYGATPGEWVIDGKKWVLDDIDVDGKSITYLTNTNGSKTSLWVVTDVDADSVQVLYGHYQPGNPGHSSDWKFVTEAYVDFTAKSMTEYGPLVGYVKIKGVYDPTNEHTFLDEAYLSLGHVLFGHTGSAANFSDGYAPGAWHGDTSTNQIKLSWAAAGFGIQLGIEDPRERWGTELAYDYNMPDITGNITVSGGHFNGKLIAGWSDLAGGGVYGVGGTVEATMDAFSVMVGGAFGTGTSYLGTAKIFSNYDNNWTAFISAKYQATPTFSVAGSFAYAANSTDGTSGTAGGAKLVWAPVAGFEAYAEGKAWKFNDESEHTWEGKVGVSRSW